MAGCLARLAAAMRGLWVARITINGVSLDPGAEAGGPRAAWPDAVDASHSDYVVIQTSEPLSDEEKAQLEELGVVIHEYVPESSYLCGYRLTDLEAIRSLPFVLWANVYSRGFKIPPALRAAADAGGSGAPMPGRWPPSRRLREIDVVLHEDVDPQSSELAARIAAAARVDPDVLAIGRRKVRLTVEEGQLDDLAALDEVHHLEEVPQRQLANNVARPILNADVFVNGSAYAGDGEVIAVADTGFDRGSTSDVHPAFAGRVAKLYALGRTHPPKADDPHGHGTHVAGSALGDANSATMGGAVQGTAPRATLVLQSLLDAHGGLGGIPVDLHDLFEPPYDNDGARIHTNSWEPTTPGLPYDASAHELDDVVWSHQDLVICFAAGNQGTDANGNGVVDAGSIGSKNGAKNCITVGASESIRDFEPTYGNLWPSNFPANPIHPDGQADNASGLAAFSSRGPTREGRIKPDVVSPGTCILSTLSRIAPASTPFGTSSDPLFLFASGTSMATPLVAGCIAVLRETLVKNGTPDPSAALLKALLINGAVTLAGQYTPSEAGPSPNNNSGWGRVNLAASVVIPGASADAGFGQAGPLEQGDQETIELAIPEAPSDSVARAERVAGFGVTLKVTLVWSDPPGAALQNDLDLIVRTANGQERHGNAATSEGFDRQNNVEQIVWAGIPPGPAQLIVRAFRITRYPQPYAYAWRLGQGVFGRTVSVLPVLP